MPRQLFKNKYLVTASVVTLILILLFTTPLLKGLRSLTIGLVSIPSKISSGIGPYFSSKRKLLAENKVLRKKVAVLYVRIDQKEGLDDENERLRDLLKLKKRLPFITISAEVITRNPNGWVDSLIINCGVEDGIDKGAAICSAEGLLGKVYEAGENTSSVMLITHPAFKTGGKVKGSRASGIVAGAGDGTVKLLYLPMDAKVDVGEVVVTSEFSRVFPKDINIGEIVSVGKSKTGLYKYAVIKPFATMSDQEEVICFK